jgi:hypothetical protein
MQDGYLLVENFFDDAQALREAFEAHFREPGKHSYQHQVWNYFYVPDTYTYLRTSPKKIMPEDLVTRFVHHLNIWATATLGLYTPTEPWLSLYVDGCGQTLHNDSLNGQLGYVFSITRWDERTFLGGDTLLFRPQNYWETERIKTSGASIAFYEKVPSRFNQLLVFDDRIIHGVQPVQGTMDPLAGRVVLHGHLKAGSLILTGSLRSSVAESDLSGIRPVLDQLASFCRPYAPLFHGFMILRASIQPDGRVSAVRSLCDRIVPITPDRTQLGPFKQQAVQILSALVFPACTGPSELTVPVLVGD